MYTGYATLQYFNNYAVAWADPAIGNYYFSLLPRYLKIQGLQRPQNPAHITVARRNIEKPCYDNWKYRDGEEIEFQYDGMLWRDELYVWLDVWSDEIAEIREKLGLPRIRETFECYHLTIANFKNSVAVRAKEKINGR